MLVQDKLIQSQEQGLVGVTRTLDFNLAKLNEEVGELAVEVQIAQNRLPKSKGGHDGVVGEAVDIILVALDIIYLNLAKSAPNVTPYKIEAILIDAASSKMKQWEAKSKQISALTQQKT